MRYIDADALIKKLFPYDVVDKKDYTINAKAVADAIANTPTADVVPKSEVADLQDALQCEKETNKHLSDEYIALQKALDAYEETSGLKQAKAEVAREIFEEIERTLDNYHSACLPVGEIEAYTYYEGGLGEALAELKKKYESEGTNDEQREADN